MRSFRVRRLLACMAAISLAVALSSCGGSKASQASGDSNVDKAGSSTSPTPSVTSDPNLPSNDDLKTYFQAVSYSDNVADLKAAQHLAQPGTVAYAYAGYHAASVQAQMDAGAAPSSGDTTFSETDKGYKTCYPGAHNQKTCDEWTDIQGSSGKIVNFKVDGKSPKGRLIEGSNKTFTVADGALDIKVLYTYETVTSPSLIVTLELHSHGHAVSTSDLYNTHYRTSDGRQYAVQDSYVPDRLAPNSVANAMVMFPDAAPGGHLLMEFYGGPPNYPTYRPSIPTR